MDAGNSRAARLGCDDGGELQLRHEDGCGEMDVEGKQSEDDDAYDMFMGNVSEDSEAGCRERMAAEVNGVTHEILHLALKMGVKPSDYAPMLSKQME